MVAFLYPLIRPFLFSLDPEVAHEIVLFILKYLGAIFSPPPPPEGAPISLMGLSFPNRVGLAAGFDKNGTAIDGLAHLGFGFIEVGTVTPRPQAGNPKPRLFRLPQARALINRMGFNNAGVRSLVAQAARRRWSGILGVNIGKNADTPIERAVDDYRIALLSTWAIADYIALNISSPNTTHLRTLQHGEHLEKLLAELSLLAEQLTQTTGKRVPLVVKIAPDLDEESLTHIATTLTAYPISAVIATNTTLSRTGVAHLPLAHQTGGLSGAPLMAVSTRIVEQLSSLLQGRLPIIAAGGILTAEDAVAKIRAGASLVQLYTGLIYRGPRLVQEVIKATAAECLPRSQRSQAM
ncbi:MAG: quinone-dependent dihydroorotate dehydrogenase [Hydrogenophilus sp.]|nr:quinone-dependent dihydroorotate dehydrogenase [Hydrogenophilus sp.]